MRTSKNLFITFLLLGLAVCTPSQTESPRPNILLLSVDTLRADHLGCYGNDRWNISPSPTLDRLASMGVLFEKCYAPRGQTHPSIASMLTGKYPITHTLRENGHILPLRHRTFIQHLHRNGYLTAAFASNLITKENPYEPEKSLDSWWTRGCDESGDGYGPDFKAATEVPIEDQWAWDERIEKKAVDWIGRYDPNTGKPFFLWTHFYDPHKPYLPHESSPDLYPDYKGPLEPRVIEVDGVPVDQVSAVINQATRSNSPLSEEDHRKVLALYDASQYGVDQRFDRILAALNEKKMLENTWIFFTSDHGEEMGEHNNYFYHGASIYNAVLRIPLIVVGPQSLKGFRTECLVQNVDLAPTILQLARAKIPPGMEGFSFIDVLQGNETSTDRDYAVAEWQEFIYAWIEDHYKYIFNPKNACPIKPPYLSVNGYFDYDREELYDLNADPREQNNIVFEKEEVVRDLRKKLMRWIDLDQHQRNMDSSETAEGTVKALQALGYTGADSSNKHVKFKD
ncbi:MAG: sulfatase-like hydrolase/transferase [Planctomycetes bacterium]|nr:sulfatase-like hydrolase/transferase [Planctomycetota bacterium]